MEVPLIGRDKELEDILEALDAANSGKGRMYFITGESGIGKTRLLREICRVAAGKETVVLEARCIDEKASPFLPINDALKLYARNTDLELVPIGLMPAGKKLDLFGNLAREKTRMFENYLRIFMEIASERTVLFVVDDLQWADSGTLGFVHYLSRSIKGLRMVCLLAYPSEAMEDANISLFATTVKNINIERNASAISLQPLTEKGVGAMLSAILETENLPEKFVHAIYKKTEGNPLFVEEIGKEIMAQGLFDREKNELKKEVETLEIPETVRSMILLRFSKLDEMTKKALRACAVIGREFDYVVLKNILGFDENHLLDILDELIAARYIEEASNGEERYRFVQNAVYEVIYSQVSTPMRRIFHKRVAVELEKLYKQNPKYFGEIGRSYILGGEFAKGVEYKILAGEYFLGNYGVEDAIRNLREAIAILEGQHCEKLERVWRRKAYELAGDCYSLTSEFENAVDAYSKALKFADGSKEKGELMVKLSYPLMKKGEFQESIRTLEETLGVVGTGEAVTRAEILMHIGMVYELKGEYRKALEFYLQSHEILKGMEDDSHLGELYGRIGAAYWFLGNLPKGKEYMEKGLEIRKKHNQKKSIAGGYNNLAVVMEDLGEIDKAIEYYVIARKIYEEIGDVSGVSTIYHNLAVILFLVGKVEQSIEFYTKSIEICLKIGDVPSAALSIYSLGNTYQDLGEYQKAIEYYRTALDMATKIDEKRTIAWVLMSTATIQAILGNLDKAMETVERAMKTAEETGNLEVIAQTVEAMGTVYRAAGRFEEAEEFFKKALGLWKETQRVESIYSNKYETARLYTDTGRFSEAASLLDDAWAFFSKVNAKPMLDKIEKERKRLEEARKGRE
ncbi:MAG: DUF2791 family P-loop domain-containing protein [Thermoplasmata archaeon]|nr:DUF2791 family P-loop domain-containing protein [Thermoplasmata archaeon]